MAEQCSAFESRIELNILNIASYGVHLLSDLVSEIPDTLTFGFTLSERLTHANFQILSAWNQLCELQIQRFHDSKFPCELASALSFEVLQLEFSMN